MKNATATVAAACLAMFVTSARAVVVSDCCDCATGGSFLSFTQGTGTASAVAEGSGGNLPPCLRRR